LVVLRDAFDPQAPQLDALALLDDLTLQAKDYAGVERLSLLGRERFPRQANWGRALAAVYREANQSAKLADILAELAESDPDDFKIHMELAELAVNRGDFEAAARWALDAIHIDVTSPNAHATRARALSQIKRHLDSIEEYETAIRLEPKNLEWRFALVKACVAAGRKDRARQVLAELLQHDAKYPGAQDLLDRLER
jgi:thioredoxin-like negative regulator of GroEL